MTDQAPGLPVRHGLYIFTDKLQEKEISFEYVGSIEDARGKTVVVAGLAAGDGEAARLLRSGNHSVPEVPEALTVWKTKAREKTVWVLIGSDDRGLMYALLDASDRIGWSTRRSSPLDELKEVTEQPYVANRAVSLYTMNRTYWESRFYDEAYWESYLDMLANNRFNTMVVIFGYENGGFLAPCYPYFFDTENYHEVKMSEITSDEQEKNLSALNQLIRMAHDRGIRLKVGIWDHIYRGGVQAGGTEGIPGTSGQVRVTGLNSQNLLSYTKAALTRFVELVPELDGIQFRMHDESGLKREEMESFWSEVFENLKETAPHLQCELRAKGLPESVIQDALDAGINFRISTKYWMEQMGLPFHPTHINRENQDDRRHGYADMLQYPQKYRLNWRLWTGGTTRVLLWGNPEYMRRFAGSVHLYDGDSYEVNEPLATKMEAQPHHAEPFDLLNPQYRYYRYEFERYWHFFQVFGRIGYNPETDPEIWQKEFESRFGKNAAEVVEKAIHQASWILPRIVASCYPYSGFPTTRGWPEKQRLGDLEQYATGEGSDIQQFTSFDEEARLLLKGGETAKIRAAENSRWFEQTYSELDQLITQAERTIGNRKSKEFHSTMTDLRILANLALYHSRRIPAAVNYRLFVHTHDISALDHAIAFEIKAAEAWSRIVHSAGDVYTDDLMMGVREIEYGNMIHRLCGHWQDELALLDEGIKRLESERQLLAAEDKVKDAPRYIVTSNTDRVKPQMYHQPVTAHPAGLPLTIHIKASSSAGIKWIRLRYRSVNQKLDYRTVEMHPAGDEDLFEAIVPSSEIPAKWDFMYFFEIMDNEGNGTIYPDLNEETPYILVRLIR